MSGNLSSKISDHAKKKKKKKITLRVEDEKLIEVDESVAIEFMTVRSFLENGSVSADTIVPLPNVNDKDLHKIIQYCKKHRELKNDDAAAANEELLAFDIEFVKGETDRSLKELILAANFLNVKPLMEFLIVTVADRIKNRSVEYIREFFGIKNDFSSSEEEMLRQKDIWAYSDVDVDSDNVQIPVEK